jgi:predicted component of type VI protein secretion system
MNANINIIEKINAVVEKFEGRIKSKVIKTGSHNSFNDSKKSIGFSLVLDK